MHAGTWKNRHADFYATNSPREQAPRPLSTLLAPIADHVRVILLEIRDDRRGNKSTIVTSQLPIDAWHTAIGEATIADTILDRLVQNGHKIELRGESMRKKRSNC